MKAHLIVYYVSAAVVPTLARGQGATFGQAMCVGFVLIGGFCLGHYAGRRS